MGIGVSLGEEFFNPRSYPALHCTGADLGKITLKVWLSLFAEFISPAEWKQPLMQHAASVRMGSLLPFAALWPNGGCTEKSLGCHSALSLKRPLFNRIAPQPTALDGSKRGTKW